jgi:alpha-glucosidase
MKSPKGEIYGAVVLAGGQLQYSAGYGQEPLLLPSRLGIEVDGQVLGSAVNTLRIERIWSVAANSATGIPAYQGYLFAAVQGNQTFQIEFRWYAEGLAFRYLMQGKSNYHVQAERTTFKWPRLPVWFFERESSWKLKTYAGLWTRSSTDSLELISKQGPIQGKPLVVELPGGRYALLTEAALYNYSGMRLKGLGKGEVQVNFTEPKGFEVKGKELQSPWRVLLYAENLSALVNSPLIASLNPAPDPKWFADKSYIKPGRSVWSWITRGDDYMEPESEKNFIKAASALSFEYTLIDEGWETKWSDKWQQLTDICTFAAGQKVGVWVWKHSKGLRDPGVRDHFLDSLASAGVVGLKTDFMDSEAKELIDFEIDLLKAAAKRRLMVNFHGCHAPTGESVTYPNEMTREGIRGMELNIMKEPIPAWHNAALPFTRLVLGHGDYTPGFFYNRGETTFTHQLAMLYLIRSPFQCLAENPIKLLADQRFAQVIPLLKELPTVWDETRVLEPSKIAEVAVMARRKGNTWYVSVINGQAKEKILKLDLSFISNLDQRKIMYVADGSGGDSFQVSHSKPSADEQEIRLLPNGGAVLKIQHP